MPETDIAEIFRLDPLELTAQDHDALIAHYRAHRHMFNAGVKPASAKKGTKKLADALDTTGIDL